MHDYFCVHAFFEKIVKEIHYVIDVYNLVFI